MTLLCSFLMISSPTNLQEEFEKNIDNNYEQYVYLINEETSVGDVIIVVGKIKEKLYVSGYLYTTINREHYFKLSNGAVYKNSFYKEIVEENVKISIYSNNTLFVTYDISCDTIEEFNDLEVITGKGENEFPKEPKKLDIIDIFIIGVFLFLGVIGVLTIFLLYLYRNQKGIFKEPIEISQINNNIIEIEVEQEEPKTKEELMQEAYDDYHNGKITENELNNRLRRIWWSEDDQD